MVTRSFINGLSSEDFRTLKELEVKSNEEQLAFVAQYFIDALEKRQKSQGRYFVCRGCEQNTPVGEGGWFEASGRIEFLCPACGRHFSELNKDGFF